MDERDRQAIDELFGKLRQVESQTRQRDPEAETYIGRQVSQLPAAPYYMAQAIVAQEHALASLQTRVQQLEQQMAQRPSGGGFLASIFGSGQSAAPPRQAMPPGYMPQQPYGQPGYGQPAMGGYGSPWGGRGQGGGFGGGGFGGGGGFLAGAMQTAVGVAGGMLVADAISSAFESHTGGEAEAASVAEPASHEAAADQGDTGFQDAAYDDTGFDAGGDFGGDDSI